MRNAVLNRGEPIFDRWPYNASTNIIDRDLAAAIRTWALTEANMSEAELHALSQRQALRAYIDGHIIPTLDRVIGRQRAPEWCEAGAKMLVAKMPPLTDPDFVKKTVDLIASVPSGIEGAINER